MEHAAETARTREVVATFYQNYRDRNFDALARGLSEEIDFCIEISQDYFPFAGTKRGRDATVASLKELVGAVEHLQYDEVFTLADGARACVFLHWWVPQQALRAKSISATCLS